MGIWGSKLYENDTSLDVKDAIEKYWKQEKTAEEIVSLLTGEFKELIDDGSSDEAFFWLAMSDTMWDFGLLLPEVNSRALSWLDREDIFNEGEDPYPEMKQKRMAMLAKLRNKLMSPQPKAKKPIKRKPRDCGWKQGDCYAFQLQGEEVAERGIDVQWVRKTIENGLVGRWILLTKIDEDYWDENHIVPILYVKITKDGSLPTSLEEYNALEYVQVWSTEYKDRFLPLDFSRLQEDIEEKSKLHYEVDEYGYLPEYRVVMIKMTKKALQTAFTFVGNFQDAAPPEKEFVPHVTFNMQKIFWRRHIECFEREFVQDYWYFNLRNSKRYLK